MAEEKKLLTPGQQAELKHEQTCQQQTVHHLDLLERLMQDLRKSNIPWSTPYAYGFERDRIEGKGYLDHHCIKGYFRTIGRFAPDEKRRLLDIYERANREYLRRAASQRLSFPLLTPRRPEDLGNPLHVSTLPPLSNFQTPWTGGRKPSASIDERNELIRQCKTRGYSAREICKVLDQAKICPPKHWGGRRWGFLYRTDALIRKRIDRLFSRVALKAKPTSYISSDPPRL